MAQGRGTIAIAAWDSKMLHEQEKYRVLFIGIYFKVYHLLDTQQGVSSTQVPLLLLVDKSIIVQGVSVTG